MSPNEKVVAKLSELSDGMMKTVEVDDHKILLVKVKGEVYAVGATCTHYGAPLEDGLLSDDRVVCPWHQAAFSIKTGDMLEPPALDSLPRYEVRVDGDDIIVALPESAEPHRQPAMTSFDPSADSRTYVILGAGAAANAAAQTLREDGFQGIIVMITPENRLPYDRPNLSKDYLQGTAEPEWMPLRPQEFYRDNGIEVRLNATVKAVEIPTRTVTFESGEQLEYDKLLIATGSAPRSLPVPGADLDNVFTLRSFDDSDAIIAATQQAKKAVVVGASFIGMEAAFSLTERNLAVTVVAPEQVPFEHVFGPEVGELFRSAHERNGVAFKLGEQVEKIEGNDSVETVVLKSGERLECDLAVIGIGVKPVTGFIKGLPGLADDGSIIVDEYFSAAENVYAAGDIARFPDWRTGERLRIEHWRTAQQQGRQAAHNMAGRGTPYTAVPFFWTMQAGLSIGYIGHAADWDSTIVYGSIAEKDFLVFYVKGDRILAAAASGRSRELNAVHELFRRGKMPPPADVKEKSFDFTTLID